MELMKFLAKENIFPNVRTLGTLYTTIIGLIDKINNHIIHYQTFEKELECRSAEQLLTL